MAKYKYNNFNEWLADQLIEVEYERMYEKSQGDIAEILADIFFDGLGVEDINPIFFEEIQAHFQKMVDANYEKAVEIVDERNEAYRELYKASQEAWEDR